MAAQRVMVAGVVLLLVACIAGAGSASEDTQVPPTYVPSGRLMYKQYCAACHGADAKGNGPMTAVLKVPPSDLTTLAKRHDGKFPYEYVSNVLEFGPGFPSHGSSEMPTWGPIFRYYDKQNEKLVKLRIKNLCDYLASLQGK